MTMSSKSRSDEFSTFLANSLPQDTKIRIYHISTLPTSSTPLFASSPDQAEQVTTCESHFLIVSRRITKDSSTVQEADSSKGIDLGDEVLVLGIEVLVYTTQSLTMIFVSKADSTGFLTRTTSKRSDESLIKTIISAFLKWLVQHHLATGPTISIADENTDVMLHSDKQIESPIHRRLVLSLFARAQNQYLFPGSVENSTKHVLDDRQLIKWWCKVLDTLVENDWAQAVNSHDGSAEKPSVESAAKITPQAYMIIPGFSTNETSRSFFPPPTTPRTRQEMRWYVKYPVEYLVGDLHSQIPIRSVIPRFPDDPKARYCGDLDTAGTDEQGKWKGIKTLQQFWETMEYRQECASGRLVGFIWLTFGLLPMSRMYTASAGIIGKTENGEAEKSIQHDSQQTLVAHPSDIQKQQESVSLDAEHYTVQADFLLNDTDFAGEELAVKSTREWIRKVSELGNVSDFGIDVVGQRPVLQKTASGMPLIILKSMESQQIRNRRSMC